MDSGLVGGERRALLLEIEHLRPQLHGERQPRLRVDAQAGHQPAVSNRDPAVPAGPSLGVGDTAHHCPRPKGGAIGACQQGKVGDPQLGQGPACATPAGGELPPSLVRGPRHQRIFLVVEQLAFLAERELMRDDSRRIEEGCQTPRARVRSRAAGEAG